MAVRGCIALPGATLNAIGVQFAERYVECRSEAREAS